MPKQKPYLCCRWQRAGNDALVDDRDKKIYCASCWQTWIEHRLTKHIALNKSKETCANSHQDSAPKQKTSNNFDFQDDEEGFLEGMIGANNELFLVSKKRGTVYSSERSDSGDRVPVGFLENGEISLFEPETPKESFPFKVNPADHCETPFVAYEDLAPVLVQLALAMNKDSRKLRIWDPYYCNGSVKRNFATLGFYLVHNECEDFYEVLASKKLPKYDCIVTNPPYSSAEQDHIALLLEFLTSQRKPWFVLQPNYVYTKPYWRESNSKSPNSPWPFFLTPETSRKYVYETPKGFRNVSSRKLHTSPFISMWYCWTGPEDRVRLYRWWASRSPDDRGERKLACSEYFLPDYFKDSSDSSRRKKKQKRNHRNQNESPV